MLADAQGQGRSMLSALPERLRERVAPCGSRRAPNPQGRWVLYWTHTALRGHDNPALEVALEVAAIVDRPVLVVQGISERYPSANDRHHTFMLECARELSHELSARGVAYALHVERPGAYGAHLKALTREAACVVTEAMPVEPLRGWTEALAALDAAPVWRVDTACVVPMPWVARERVEGAGWDASAHLGEVSARLRTPERVLRWDARTPDHAPLDVSALGLPFEPVPIGTMGDREIAALVAECSIDHSVGPIAHTRGGSMAGYTRWERFKMAVMPQYDALRSDPTQRGTSRMSAYLRYGCVSPFRLVRDAVSEDGPSTRALLDGLLIRREQAYHFCDQHAEHRTLGALPRWARESLEAHRDDPRDILFSWERFARAQTGDAAWDAAQTSLVVHGEVHPQVRRQWGVSLLNWTRGPAEALELLIDLNDRFALDGREPSSYVGALECMGLFDRPVLPERAVTGAVPNSAHVQRAANVDVETYAQRIGRPSVSLPDRVAVIGAGMSGLFAARVLHDHKLPVVVFDKGRAPGGRLSTRRREGRCYDHGAQYFTARDPSFRRYVEAWIDEGHVARWGARIKVVEPGAEVRATRGTTERFVGVPTMSAVARHLSMGCEVRSSTRVARMEPQVDGTWRLWRDDGSDLGAFERVVLALPAPQAAELLRDPAPELAAQVERAVMAPCWTTMVAFDAPLSGDVAEAIDAAFVHDSPLSWMARGASKPGRRGGERWLLHATVPWSREHLERERPWIADAMLDAFREAMGLGVLPEPAQVMAHRWRFASVETPLDQPCIYDVGRRLGVCGDWCLGSRLEAAFLSGSAVAGRVLGTMR